jgi:hypothetical protein
LIEALLLAGSLDGLPVSARVDGARAVERARYRFVIGATQPFDRAYPRSVFERKVVREIAEERVLQKFFGVAITRDLLRQEFQRIERDTKAPDQWSAIKNALGNDRQRIEEIFCRPLLVERALRTRFAFDGRIHAVPHRKAREAREGFRRGQTPAGVSSLSLSRTGARSPTTDELFERSKAEAALPRVLATPGVPGRDDPMPVDPEMAAVLERELVKPGDVTTILEERDRLSVFQLKEKTRSGWIVDALTFPKVDFDSWFEKVRRSP